MSEYIARQGTTALGIIGTVLGGIATAGGAMGLGGAYMNNGYGGYGCSGYVTHNELALMDRLSEERQKSAILASEQASEVKMADVYERLANRINTLKDRQEEINREQAVYNGVNNTLVGQIRSQIDELTTLHVRRDKVCPLPMRRYNNWTAPTEPAPDNDADAT